MKVRRWVLSVAGPLASIINAVPEDEEDDHQLSVKCWCGPFKTFKTNGHHTVSVQITHRSQEDR